MSDRVPVVPVVEILVSADQVSVNGRRLDVHGTPDSAQLRRQGVHQVARDFAQPLGRPVRAIAHDADGTIHLVIHPDGHVSDARDPDDKNARHHHKPTRATLRRTTAAAAVVAVLGTATWLVLTGRPSGVATPASPSSPSPMATPTAPPTPAPHSPTAPALARLSVSATPDQDRLVLTMINGAGPTQVLIIVTSQGSSSPIKRQVTVSRKGARVTVTGLPPGLTSWRVEPTQGTPISGRTQITPPDVTTESG